MLRFSSAVFRVGAATALLVVLCLLASHVQRGGTVPHAAGAARSLATPVGETYPNALLYNYRGNNAGYTYEPIPASVHPENVTDIVAGAGFGILLNADGTVQQLGKLGEPPNPPPVGVVDIVQIASNMCIAAAVKNDGTLYFWRPYTVSIGCTYQFNLSGAKPRYDLTIPAEVTSVKKLVMTDTHAMVLKSDGTVYGWDLQAADTPLYHVNPDDFWFLDTINATHNITDFTLPTYAYREPFVFLKSDNTLSYVTTKSNISGDRTYNTHAIRVISPGFTPKAIQTCHLPGFSTHPDYAPDYIVDANNDVWSLLDGVPLPGFYEGFTYQSLVDAATFAKTNFTTLQNSKVQRIDRKFYFGHCSFLWANGRHSNAGYYVTDGGTGEISNYLPRWGEVTDTERYNIQRYTTHRLAMTAYGGYALMTYNPPPTPTITLTPSPYRTATRSITRTPCAATCQSIEIWGDDNDNIREIPTGLNTVQSLSIYQHVVALLMDGTVAVWGGSPWITPPPSAPVGLTGVVDVAAGAQSLSVFVKSDGTVTQTGGPSDGSWALPAGLSGVRQVEAGSAGAIALKTDGTVVVWPTTTANGTDVSPPAGLTDVVKVVAGENAYTALKSDGTVVAWGSNTYGQQDVPAGLVAADIAQSTFTTIARKTDGTLVTWGTPPGWAVSFLQYADTPAGLTTVRQIRANGYNLAAQKPDGTWVFWGVNYYGQNGLPSYVTPAHIQDVAVGAFSYGVILSGSMGPTHTPSKTPTASKTFTATSTPTKTATLSPTHTSTKTPTASKTLTRTVTMTPSGNIYTTLLNPNPLMDARLGTPPANMNGVIQAQGGTYMSAAVFSDGHAVAWYGYKLTDGTGLNHLIAAAAEINAATGLAALDVESWSTPLGLKTDGTVVSFGCGSPPYSSDLNSACDIPAGLSGVIRVQRGYVVAHALRADHTVVSWGSSYLPTWYTGYTDIIDVASQPVMKMGTVGHEEGVIVVRSDGSVETNMVYDPTKQLVTDAPGHTTIAGLTGIRRVYPIYTGALALKSDGTLWCWCEGTVTQLLPHDAVNIVEVDPDYETQIAVVRADGTAFGIAIATRFLPSHGVTAMYPACQLNNVVHAMNAEQYITFFSRNEPTCPTATPTLTASRTLTPSLTKTPCAITCGYSIEAWGTANNQVVLANQSNLTGVSAVAAGAQYAVAVRTDGSLGLIGNGTTAPYIAALPSGSSSGVTAVAAGGTNYIMGLKSDGTVVASGGNHNGDWTTPAGLTGVTAIDAGPNAAIALKSDGTVVTWPSLGNNASWGLVPAPAGLTGVTAVTIGRTSAAALKSDGTVTAWGLNVGGATDVPAGLSGVTAIASGDYFTLALKSDGTVVAWGEYSDSCCSSATLNIPAGTTGVTKIVAGPNGALLYKSDGTWIGIGSYSPTDQTAPAVPAGVNNITDIALGNGYAIAVLGTPGAVASATRTPTASPAGPTQTPTRSLTATKSPTRTQTPKPTVKPKPSATATLTRSATPTRTNTYTPSLTRTRTPTKAAKPTKTPTKSK